MHQSPSNASECQRKGFGSGMFPFNNKQTLQLDEVFCTISGVANILYKSKIVFYYSCRPCLGNHLEPDVQFKAHMKQAVLEAYLSKLEEQTWTIVENNHTILLKNSGNRVNISMYYVTSF
jgi:hypothetical protein